MEMTRRVEAEWLDVLPPADPRAMRSRRDLERVNALMTNASIVADALRSMLPEGPATIAEIGAGDSAFALRVARALPARAPPLSRSSTSRRSSLSDTRAGFDASAATRTRCRPTFSIGSPICRHAALDAIVANLSCITSSRACSPGCSRASRSARACSSPASHAARARRSWVRISSG
jgi:hypothetical protein